MALLYSKFQNLGGNQLLPPLTELTEILGNANHFKLLQLPQLVISTWNANSPLI